jgi:hypothetical protein
MMLVAALSGNGGCEITAISNLLRTRDDQIGYHQFTPADTFDGQRQRQRA